MDNNPTCCGQAMSKAGKAWSGYNKVQRYRCQKCGKTTIKKGEGEEKMNSERIITSAQVKENNGGGLQIEVYDQNDEIMHVVCFDYVDQDGYADLKGIIDGDWSYTDASEWYDAETNSMGDTTEDNSRDLTASDVVDNHESTKVIAEYDGKVMHIYFDRMGNAGQKYFTPKD